MPVPEGLITLADSIHGYLVAGLAVTAMLLVGVGGWASVIEIHGAVIAPGTLVVHSRAKEVQHQSGGIVAEIRFRDGDQVQEGEILVRLDPTVARSNLATVSKSLDELIARRARLFAEREGAAKIRFPVDLLHRADALEEVAHLISGEQRLFELRQLARSGMKSQLEQRLSQLNDEIEGYAAQLNAKTKEIELVERELTGARELWQKNLLPIARLTELERTATRIEGERGQLIATLAQSRGKIGETQLKISQIDLDLSGEVGRELREIEARIGELEERKVTAVDQLERIDIRAPQSGSLHQSIVHTVGGVISAGRTLMLIVPNSDRLIVEAKIAPQYIDQLQLGQAVMLRFSSFNQRTTPEIVGGIERISADVTTDQHRGESFYTVRVTIAPEEIDRLGAVKLVPGMPVETFIKTSERTAFSYLMKPLQDQISRAFRER